MQIVQEEKDYILVHKEAFMATQTARLGEMDLYSQVKNYLVEKYKEKKPYLALINRLDQPVEGLVLLARNQKAAADLSRQLQNNQIEKYYLAVVHGVIQEDEDKLTNFVFKNPKTNLSEIVSEKNKNGKKAVLSYLVIKRSESRTLVKIHLHTGRHHQIRVQMAYAGYPLLGDMKYGNTESIIYSRENHLKTIALCAYKICFSHPASGLRIEKEIIPVQEEIRQII